MTWVRRAARIRRTNDPATVFGRSEQSGKTSIGIETRPAQPIDASISAGLEQQAGVNERAAGDFHPMLENSRKRGKRVEQPHGNREND